MSRYLDRMLLVNEHIVYSAHLHWIIYHFGLTTTIAGSLLGRYGRSLVVTFMGENMAVYAARPIMIASLVIIAIGALHLFFGYIRQISTEFVITNQRVIAKHGFIATTTFEVMIYKVAGANIDQTVIGRLLGYGTVMVTGTGGDISPIDHVADPYRFHSALMGAMEQAQKPDGGQGAKSIRNNE